MLTTIWYPAGNEATEKEITIGAPDKPLFISGRAARDAKLLPGKKRRPLVVLSHGTGGSALQLMWLGKYLARRRFIVAAANHHGNTGAEEKPNAQGSRLWWERSRDLSVTIDKMLAECLVHLNLSSQAEIDALNRSCESTTKNRIAQQSSARISGLAGKINGEF